MRESHKSKPKRSPTRRSLSCGRMLLIAVGLSLVALLIDLSDIFEPVDWSKIFVYEEFITLPLDVATTAESTLEYNGWMTITTIGYGEVAPGIFTDGFYLSAPSSQRPASSGGHKLILDGKVVNGDGFMPLSNYPVRFRPAGHLLRYYIDDDTPRKVTFALSDSYKLDNSGSLMILLSHDLHPAYGGR